MERFWNETGRRFDSLRLDRVDALAIAFICAWGLSLLAPGLGHPGMHDWDEVLHQAAARGTYDTFFYPHFYRDPLFPVAPHDWLGAAVWLHKPIAPLWFGATLMHLIGVTPLAMRIGALLGQLGAAVAIYLLARNATGRFWSSVGACGFLALPFGWVLTQGLLFGDSYDCMLVGFVSLTLVLLVHTIEKDSWRWAVLAGVALGLGHLTKTVLALAPLGVAGVMVGLRWLRFSKGLRPTHFLIIGGTALLVSGPWNLYAALTWPEVYQAGANLTFGHINAPPGVDVGGWRRPVDAIFVEVNATEFSPLLSIFPLVMGVWLIIRGVQRREPAILVTALWVWSTWLTHSFVAVKAPGHVWNAAPAVFVGLAIAAVDARRFPALGAATIAALLTPEALRLFPALGHLRTLVPPWLPQARVVPGLVEGAVLCLGAALITWGTFILAKRTRWISQLVGLACMGLLLLAVGYRLPSALRAQPEKYRGELLTSYHHVLGPVLDRVLPEQSVLFQVFDHDPRNSFELHSSLFWSGRMTYRGRVDFDAAHAKGYHVYIVSPAAEPYVPIPGVPAHSWLRAYDAEAPASPPPIPEGATPLNVQVDRMRILGFASGPLDGGSDQWTFFMQPEGVPHGLPISFLTRDGRVHSMGAEPELSLRRRENLAGAAWFILPILGPPRAQVSAIEFGAQRQRVTLEEERLGRE
ncbi:ArnT family glycosyltransferase [Hyalangium sp.]|uniref:ArnT family glycosyltransferase n=1 Tax=Hyalangium sp. TaxID=2028555 RepID=UPI002D5A4E40|nr:glycosyltransferase family 39 protein [Hyalangium sp.]HYH99735.1 glycosyltransferase family 39 protein [Hyalangium sp.]